MAENIFVENIDLWMMAKGFLGKHPIDAGVWQFRSTLKWVGKIRGVFVAGLDPKDTFQICSNCRITVRKQLPDRIDSCPECHDEIDRDIASVQERCNRGRETYGGTLEKQASWLSNRVVGEQGSRQVA